MSSKKTVKIEDIPGLVHDALIEEFGDDQDRCVRGYVPTQSLKEVMKFIDPEQIQELRGTRIMKDKTESFHSTTHSLPPYVSIEEQLQRDLKLHYDRADGGTFDWGRVRDFLADSELADIAISKVVLRMENPKLRDHLFTLLQHAIDYPASYSGEFTDPFYFVMESRSPEKSKDYRNIESFHDQGYLQELGWNPRCLDLMSIWSHYAWTNSGNLPMGRPQRDIEEYAFNQRQADKPVFGAVNSPLVVNRWRSMFFSKGATDMRHYEWEESQQGWVRQA